MRLIWGRGGATAGDSKGGAATGELPPDALVAAIVDGAPEATVRRLARKSTPRVDGAGMLPLHWAAVAGAPAGVIRHLLKQKAGPGGGGGGGTPAPAAAVRDVYGMLPLHLALASGAPMATVMALLRANPAAATEADGLGRLPLHLGLARGAPPETVQELLSREAASRADAGGMLALHEAAAAAAPAETVLRVLEANPAAAATPDRRGRLPLHWAAARGAGPAAVEALLSGCAGGAAAAAARDLRGRLPLHCALSDNRAQPAVVRALLGAHPEALAARDRAGRLPIHCALECAAPLEAVELLLHPPGGRPEPREEKNDPRGDGDGEAPPPPLHLALAVGSPGVVVEALLLGAGDAQAAAFERDPASGELPLHAALRHAAPPNVLRLVMGACDLHEAAAARDAAGRLPLHSALAAPGCARLEAVVPLLRAYPEAVAAEAGDGGDLPMDLALANDAPPEVIMALQRAARFADGAAGEGSGGSSRRSGSGKGSPDAYSAVCGGCGGCWPKFRRANNCSRPPADGQPPGGAAAVPDPHDGCGQAHSRGV